MAWLANCDLWRLALALVLGAATAPAAMAQPVAGDQPNEPAQAPPKSLLPEFLEDVPAEPVTAAETPAVPPPGPAFGTAPSESVVDAAAAAAASTEATAPPDPLANLVGPVTLPENAGLLDDRSGGLGAGLFDGSDGRLVGTLLRRIDAPLASRWAQILLNRALLTRARPPAGLNPADWLAARGEALVAIGSANDAHRMIGRIIPDRFTAGLYAVSANAAIASADPIALCQTSATAASLLDNPFWLMADAMCRAIAGDDFGAAQSFDRLRRRGEISGFDVGLAERMSSATGSGRRGANPAWDEIGGLSAWRIGVASAAGLEIPDALMAEATPAQKAWAVRMAGQPMARRLTLMPEAAAIGALSAAEANRLLAASAADLAASALSSSPGGQARAAQSAASADDRIAALRGLLRRGADGSLERHGWQVASALSAAQLPPSPAALDDAPQIVGALLSAGLVPQARTWWASARDADSDVRAGIWAQLAPADALLAMDDGLFDRWAEAVSPHRAALLAAGLRGLGRGDVGPAPPAIDNGWTRALDAAVAGRRRGEVVVLAATGMQMGWANVPPDYLRRIAAALVAVGLAPEAGLIVAEAANRG